MMCEFAPRGIILTKITYLKIDQYKTQRLEAPNNQQERAQPLAEQ